MTAPPFSVTALLEEGLEGGFVEHRAVLAEIDTHGLKHQFPGACR